MKLYISSGALLLLGLIYIPLLIWLLTRLWRSLHWHTWARIAALAVVFLMAAAVPLADVTATSIAMAGLCRHAGLFVHKSVRVDGFYTNLGGPDLLARGFKYIEKSTDTNGLIVYATDEGKVVKQIFDASQYVVKSRYQFVYHAQLGPYQGRKDIEVERSIVRDRENGEELGYAVRYVAYPGWLDRITVAKLGQVMWSCQGVQGQGAVLMERVLLPLKE